MKLLDRWKQWANALKIEVYTLLLACRDPETPWPAKALAAVVVAYALSPIDLIPDFIPVFGYLDDMIVVPLGIALVLRMIPPEISARYRLEARRIERGRTRSGRIMAVIIIAVWLFVLFLVVRAIAGW